MGIKSIIHRIPQHLKRIWSHKNRFLSKRSAEKLTVLREEKPEKPKEFHTKLNFSQNSPQENAFYVHNGKILHNLDELSAELITIDKETFKYHVNDEKNDFSNWIRDIFHSPELAWELSSTHDLYSTREILEKHRMA